MTNVKQIIDRHNKTKLSNNAPTNKNLCNCRRKDECLMQSKCLADSIVYIKPQSRHMTNNQSKRTLDLRKAPLKQDTITTKLLLLTQLSGMRQNLQCIVSTSGI